MMNCGGAPLLGAVLLLSMAISLPALARPLLAAKAAAIDLIAIGAAYGALTAVGMRRDLVRLSGPVPVRATCHPCSSRCCSACRWTTSSLCSRCPTALDRTGIVRSLRDGQTDTWSVITVAASIMVGGFLAFVPNDARRSRCSASGSRSRSPSMRPWSDALLVSATIARRVPSTTAWNSRFRMRKHSGQIASRQNNVAVSRLFNDMPRLWTNRAGVRPEQRRHRVRSGSRVRAKRGCGVCQ